MSRSTLAGLVAGLLSLLVVAAAALLPVPYVTYAPGITVDVLAEQEGEEIVEVSGTQTYRDDGELRMTTVYVTQPEADVTLFDAMAAWIDEDRALYPYDSVYRQDETAESQQTESSIAMVSSQDTAIAVALDELGYDVTPVVEVLNVEKGLPADGRLKVRDVIVEVDGRRISSPQQVVDQVAAAPTGQPVAFVVRRDGARQRVEVTPELVDGRPRVGVSTGPGYQFPFQISVNIADNIGGPSAGLMFALAIYDTLTPGSLTGGRVVAGTGTVDDNGRVGPIGGIQQKVVAAEQSGAELFLVPSDNCGEALGAPVDDLRLVRATTMSEARASVETWAADPGASLPSCEAAK